MRQEEEIRAGKELEQRQRFVQKRMLHADLISLQMSYLCFSQGQDYIIDGALGTTTVPKGASHLTTSRFVSYGTKRFCHQLVYCNNREELCIVASVLNLVQYIF